YTVEIRSLNNRYYKANIKLPEALQSLEADIDGWLRASLGRGSVTYTLRVHDDSPAAAYKVNVSALRAYLDRLRQVKLESAPVTMYVAALSNLPGVCQPPEVDDATWSGRKAIVEKLTRTAIDALMNMRRTEGRALRDHLLEVCDAIRLQRSAIQ